MLILLILLILDIKPIMLSIVIVMIVLTAVHIFPNRSMKFSRLVYLRYGVKIDLCQF